MNTIFINKNSEIRSGFKIAVTFLCYFIFTAIFSIIATLLYLIYMVETKQVQASNYVNFINSITNLNNPFYNFLNLLQCLAMILAVTLHWKHLDKKPISDLGFINIKKGYVDLIIGLILGAASLTIVFVLLLETGNITLNTSIFNPTFSLSLISSFILFIFVGINEELFARGYCMTVLKQTGNKWIVIIFSSIIFSLMHSFNPDMTFLSYFNLFLFGLFTAYMFIKSGNLWLSIGYHITWNYFEGNIFGFKVSGQGTNSIYIVHNSVNNFINGGSFGPEGGITVTFILLLGFAFMWKIYKPSYDNKLKENTAI